MARAILLVPVLSMLLSGPAAAEFRQIDLTIYGMD
jgi:hypothetical protein